jgi:MFS family permease
MALLLALAVGIVLSDSSVVTLALPAILREFDAGVSSVAWVLIAFNLALALAAVGAARVAQAGGRRAFAAATVVFALASLACAAPSLGALVAARAVQGVAGAVVVAGALELLVRMARQRRPTPGADPIALWAAAGVLGAAVGPALGGFLTEAFSWQAMFALQAPVALLGLAGARGGASPADPAAPPAGPPALPAGPAALPADPAGPPARPAALPAGPAALPADPAGPPARPAALPAGPAARPAGRPPLAPLVALALVSAALAAALFLLVVMLIEGWRLSPGEAALVVTAMPLAALVAGRLARERHGLAPALPGAVLLAGGLAALGLLPGSGAAWTIAPQLAIGAGLGFALGALIGASFDRDAGAVGRPAASALAARRGDSVAGGVGRPAASALAARRGDSVAGAVGRPAAWTIAARHAGIVAGLLVLTPIFTADLDAAVDPAQRAGLALVLDAPIDLRPKIALARALDAELRDGADQQLPDLGAAFARVDFPVEQRAAAARLQAGLDDELDRAATSAFRRSFLAAALIALLAAAAATLALRSASTPRTPAHAANGSRLAPPLSLNVALPGAAAVATILVAAHVALGGAAYGPTASADPCAARGRPHGVGRTQLTLLATVDGAACRLRLAREPMLLALLGRRRPRGVSENELGDALRAGVDRAQREGALGGLAATALRFALRIGGARLLIDRLLGG